MSKKNLYIAIDQGGGSTRALVFDQRSRIVAKASQSVGVEHPRLGWVEQDAEDLSGSVTMVIDKVLPQLGDQASNVVAAGLATQRSNVVCWRRSTGQALSPAISWQDRRASKWIESFRDQQHTIRQITGLVLSPHYGVSKIKWCLENIDAVADARKENDLVCGPLASFLLARLTNTAQAVVDPANASRTLLWSIHQGDWDAQLLQLFGIDDSYLPRCTHSYDQFGELRWSGGSIPVTVVTGDQSAALYAEGRPVSDVVRINMGTGVFIQCPTAETPVDVAGLLCSMVYRDESKSMFVIESTINGASNALMEIEDTLGISGDEAEKNLPSWFEQYPDPPLFLNGVAGLAAPYWIPEFKSRFVGSGCAEEKILAVAESILFLVKVNMDLLQKHHRLVKTIKLTGGLSRADCLCQKMANLLGIPVVRSEQTEATAMGLAYLTAGSPESWQVSADSRVFEPLKDDALVKRFHLWQVEMNSAVEKYQAAT